MKFVKLTATMAFLLVPFLAPIAHAQKAKAVASCGTASQTITPGQFYDLTIDTTQTLCTVAGGGGSGGNVNLTGINGTAPGTANPLAITPVIGGAVNAAGNPLFFTQIGATPAGTNVIGHVITDTSSTTAVTALPALPAGTNGIGTVNPTTAASWGIGATGSAAPANAQLMGASDGTNMLVPLVATATKHLIIDCGSAGGSCGSSVSPITPVVSTSAEASHVLKASAGTLFGVTATNFTATAGFLVVVNATTAPTTGSAITPLACVPLQASGFANINYNPGPGATYSTGITALVTSAANCFTFTSGTITAFIGGAVQ